MVTVSLFGIMVLIFVTHTVLTHLINWFFREVVNEPELVTTAVICGLLEIIIMISILHYYTT